MIRQVLMQFDMAWLPMVGLGIFFTVFLGVLLWVFRRSARSIYAVCERMPLEKDQTLNERSGT
jgi:cbb3-type cytochrome oxidase subunit 3